MILKPFYVVCQTLSKGSLVVLDTYDDPTEAKVAAMEKARRHPGVKIYWMGTLGVAVANEPEVIVDRIDP